MSNSVYVGVDMGSTSLKVSAYDAMSGAVLAQSGSPVPWERSAGGVCQVAGHRVGELMFSALSDVVVQLDARASQVAAISCVGHGGGLYGLRVDRTLFNDHAVSSTDQRATARANQLAAAQGHLLANTVGCGPWSGQPTMIAADICHDDPLQNNSAHHLFFAKDYMAMLLSGAIFTDYSDASTPGLLDLKTGKPSVLAFEAAAVPGWTSSLLAPLANSGDQIGVLSSEAAAKVGLKSGIPVAMGAIDLLAAMTGVGAVQEGDMTAVFGTWSVNTAIAPALMPALGPRESEPGLSNVMLYNSHGQTVLMNNSPASMANVSWLSNLIGTTALQVVQMAFDHSVPGANGLSFVPFINGGGHYSAGFVGLRSFHTKADMARAVVEGVVALHAKSLNAMCNNRFARKRLFVLGGGSGDMRMCQLLASMLGEPVLTPGVDESGARGAAMYGAMAIGQPTAQLAAPLHSVAPNPQWQKHYATFLQDFEQLLSTMEPVFAFKKGVQP